MNCDKKGHKFEPRYDYGKPTIPSRAAGMSAKDMIQILEATRSRKYVQDVCVKCGKVVNRYYD